MLVSRSRTALLALGLLVTMNGPGFFVQSHLLDRPRSWDGPVVRELFLALAIGAGAVVAYHARRDWDAASPRTRAIIAVVAAFSVWIVATSLWSVAPEITRERSVIYLGLACFAWLLATTPAAERRDALVGAVVLALGASAVALLFSDSIAYDINDDWRGIFTGRNSLSPVAGLGVLCGIGLAVERRGRARVGALVLAVVGVAMMLGSGSRTAWLAGAAAGGAALFVIVSRRVRDRGDRRARMMVRAAGALGAVGAVILVVQLWDESTLTQRRTIWDFVWEQIGERPIHGHGWFTMWTQPEFTSQHYLLTRGSAHDSFLEVWLGAGLVGTVGFVAIVATAVAVTAGAAWRRPSALTWTWLAVVLFLVLENITESFVLWFSYNWVLLMAAALTAGFAPPGERDRETHETSEPVSA